MARRSPYEIMRTAAWARMGWNHATAVIVVPPLFLLGASLAFVGALALGALWVWIEVPHEILASIVWLIGLFLAGLAFRVRNTRVRVLLTSAAALFVVAAYATART